MLIKYKYLSLLLLMQSALNSMQYQDLNFSNIERDEEFVSRTKNSPMGIKDIRRIEYLNGLIEITCRDSQEKKVKNYCFKFKNPKSGNTEVLYVYTKYDSIDTSIISCSSDLSTIFLSKDNLDFDTNHHEIRLFCTELKSDEKNSKYISLLSCPSADRMSIGAAITKDCKIYALITSDLAKLNYYLNLYSLNNSSLINTLDIQLKTVTSVAFNKQETKLIVHGTDLDDCNVYAIFDLYSDKFEADLN